MNSGLVPWIDRDAWRLLYRRSRRCANTIIPVPAGGKSGCREVTNCGNDLRQSRGIRLRAAQSGVTGVADAGTSNSRHTARAGHPGRKRATKANLPSAHWGRSPALFCKAFRVTSAFNMDSDMSFFLRLFSVAKSLSRLESHTFVPPNLLCHG